LPARARIERLFRHDPELKSYFLRALRNWKLRWPTAGIKASANRFGISGEQTYKDGHLLDLISIANVRAMPRR
jgi:hypothetical protein